jgi:hypothetical protein
MDLLHALVELLMPIWDLDERPDAQRFTWGCMIFVIVVLLGVYVWQHFP